MYTGVVITSDEKIREECRSIIYSSGEIRSEFYNSIDEIESKPTFFNYLFILVSDLNHYVIEKISDTQHHAPGLPTIFYNHSLNYTDPPEIEGTSKVKMIIGEDRKANLFGLLDKLKANYWRKIPYAELGIDYDRLSPRMQKALQHIEFAPIRECSANAVAAYLNISAGYFSQEFKRETHKSFRTFMQDVLDYYEEVIFSKVNLPAKNISQILGYSELSSFSRSFKKRKGISPTKYKKLVRL